MGWNLRKNSGKGWTSVIFEADKLSFARVSTAAADKPQLLSWQIFAKQGSDLDTLKRLRASAKLGKEPVCALLRHGQYRMLQVALPDIPAEEQREALRWKIKDMVDFQVDRAGIDYLPIPRTGSGHESQAFVVAVDQARLTETIRLYQDAGIELAAIDVPEFAQRNLAALFEDTNRGLATLVFNDAGGQLTFTFQGELFVTRHIDVKVAELVAASGDSMGVYERVLLDVQRSLDNFDRNFSAIALTKLLVAPVPGAAGFIDYLKSNVYQTVEPLLLSTRMDTSRIPGMDDPVRQNAALMSIGAALRDESAVAA